MSAIFINGNRLDPAPRIHALALQTSSGIRTSAEDGDAAEFNYILIQTKLGPLDPDQKGELRNLSVQIQEYVGTNTYLCHYTPPNLNPIRSLDFISYAELYQPELVVEKSLTHSEDPADVQIILHDGVSSKEQLEQISAQIADAAGISADQVNFDTGSTRLRLSKVRRERIARLDAVKYINKIPKPRLLNNVARQILYDNNDTIMNDDHYKGKGQIVCVADTGFDTGDKDDCHHAFGTRVLKLYPRGRRNKSDDPDGHGTHVCCSVLGDGKSPANGGRIESPASKANLLMQSVFSQFNPNPDAPNPDDPQVLTAGLDGIGDSFRNLFQEAYRDNARIHTNSWGSPTGQYAAAAEEIDAYLWGKKDMTVLFAAGNEGVDVDMTRGKIDPGSISLEALSKNCITVGASESLRPDISFGSGRPLLYRAFGFGFAPLSNDKVANNSNGLAAFSSRGPTNPDEPAENQRYKPDVVAPGTCILSARSSRILQGRYSESWGVPNDDLWAYEGGTSMATPLVAGCCAVIRGCLVDNGTPTPSAALIKALLINGATEIRGQYNPSEIGDAPNSDAGFGRVNIPGSLASIVPVSNQSGGFKDGLELNERAPNNTHSFTIPVSQNGPKTLKITLVWTDAPGSTLQNALDLIVTDPAGTTEMHGNMRRTFSGPGQRQAANFDRKNNVQQVFWKETQAGDYSVQIKVNHITSDEGKQPFAYAWHLY